jgi:CRISPR-associated protein Cas2
MFVVISYDIEDDRLRTRLAKVLEAHGRRVQYSVFECHLSRMEYDALQDTLTAFREQAKRRDKPTGFSVRSYRMCRACEGKIDIVGKGHVTSDPNYYLI